MTTTYSTVKSAHKRLVATYLSIIMALTLSFSAALYIQSVNEAKVNLQRQQQQLSDYLYFATPESIQQIQNTQLRLFKQNLLKRLAVLNIAMFVIGMAVSQYLSKRSLNPLKEALDSQGRFTSDAAHELRTPLTAMKTEIDVSLRDKSLKLPEAKSVLKSNLEEISKLQTLTDALLRLAKNGEQVDKTYWQTYKIIDILNTARDRLAIKSNAKKIKVNLPKTNLNVYGDSGQLVELFVTILGNAIKYSHEKSKVDIVVSSQKGRVMVKVADKGVGISEVDLPHIFERFYRADHSRRNSSAEGYGLGLSLAQAIVEAHNGHIEVDSEYGKGSTFKITLPNSAKV